MRALFGRTLGMASFVAVALFASACGTQATHDDHDDDHDAPVVTYEGDALLRALDADGVSAPVAAPAPFVRLGMLWDGEPDSFEVRVSHDGQTWSSWASPDIVSIEEQAHVGRLDVEGDASWLQFRVPAGKAPPTFLAFDPVAVLPELDDEELGGPPASPEQARRDDAVAEGIDWALPEGVGSTARELSTPIGYVRTYSRADWGARSPRCRQSTSPYRVVIHHTVTPNADSMTIRQRLRQIQNYHMDVRGYCDIAYHWLMDRNGELWRGRGTTTLGGHTLNNNTGNVAISFIGDYTSRVPTAKQVCSTARFIRYLNSKYGVRMNRTYVKGHRQYGGTACPGTALYNKLDSIVYKARNGC